MEKFSMHKIPRLSFAPLMGALMLIMVGAGSAQAQVQAQPVRITVLGMQYDITTATARTFDSLVGAGVPPSGSPNTPASIWPWWQDAAAVNKAAEDYFASDNALRDVSVFFSYDVQNGQQFRAVSGIKTAAGTTLSTAPNNNLFQRSGPGYTYRFAVANKVNVPEIDGSTASRAALALSVLYLGFASWRRRRESAA